MSDRGRRIDKRNSHGSHGHTHPHAHGHTYHSGTPNHYYNGNGNGGGPNSNFNPKSSYHGPPRGITKKEEIVCPLCGRLLDAARIRRAEHLKQCAETVLRHERNETDKVEDPEYETFFENLKRECEKLELEKRELESVQQLAEQCINKERLDQIQGFLRKLVEEKMHRNDSLCTTNIVATTTSPKGTTEEVADITYLEPVKPDTQIKEEEEKSNENVQVTINNEENKEPKRELATSASKKMVLDKQRLKKTNK